MTDVATPATPKRTPLYDAHVAAGAKIVDFAGFEMPIKYTSESVEHQAVRHAVGVFDVSHMGEVFVRGPRALDAVQRLVTCNVHALVDGQCGYAGLLTERGTFIDDVIVNRISDSEVLICVNAGNQDKDFAHIAAVVAREFPTVRATNEGAQWSQLAVQGPHAVDVVAKLCGAVVRDIKGYHFICGDVVTQDHNDAGIIARTGYTGEDGFELYVHNSAARRVWDAVLAAGAVPCGLACRDTLRLEAGLCLYGNDIDDTRTPLEANLGFIVKGAGFIGEAALAAQKAAGGYQLLRGIEMVDRGIARHGYAVLDAAGGAIGTVTSGTQSPFVNKAIGFAYLNRSHAEPGTEVFVDVRGKPVKARVCKLPFYKRANKV